MGGWVGRGKPGYQEAGVTDDELEDMLLAWGRCYGEGRGSAWQEDRSLTGDSPLAALAGKKGATQMHNRRSGQGLRKLSKIPAWASDPTPAKETRTPRPAYDRFETPAVIRVQAAWIALSRVDPKAANAVRIHYQRRGITRKERAAEADMTLETYKSNVRLGKAWLSGCMFRMVA